MTERTFRIREACAAAGVGPYRLHQWISRGYYVPLCPTRRGVWREYTMRDAVHIAAIVELTAAGVPAARAAQILGTSPLDTAGRPTVIAQQANTEIHINLAAVSERVRNALT